MYQVYGIKSHKEYGIFATITKAMAWMKAHGEEVGEGLAVISW